MNDQPRHARASDLPGWPCPPRVRDIPGNENSWGYVPLSLTGESNSTVVQDELGYLWVNGTVAPVFTVPRDGVSNPGTLVFWTADGIGLWVHPHSLQFLPSVSRLDLNLDEWLPVREVAAEWPAFIKDLAP